mgnify:CR=1 FL=1
MVGDSKTYILNVINITSMSRWIQNINLKKGRLHNYIARTYGKKAFEKHGSHKVIKTKYLHMALKKAKKEHNKSLEHAINLAITLRKFRKR